MVYLFRLLIILCLLLPIASLAQDKSNPCLKSQAFHIVVLGSSTAAGAGPSVPDSTWVNRYRKFIQEINPANQVTNLAQGGTNTYQIMPTWFVPPPGRPTSNPARNITQAILLGADAVIINMPSNDAAGGIGTNEQLFNFHCAECHGVQGTGKLINGTPAIILTKKGPSEITTYITTETGHGRDFGGKALLASRRSGGGSDRP